MVNANTKRSRTDSDDSSKAAHPVKKRVVSSACSATFSPSSSSESANTAALSTTTRTTISASFISPRQPCKNALLVVSTYHAVMAGLVYKKDKFYIKFSVKRHVGCVNGIALTERYIASSGVDERIFLFTNKAEERLTAATRKKIKEVGEPLAIRLADLGSIAPPAEVTTLAFANRSQVLLCGCADGQLLLYRCREWSFLSSLIVHESAVVGLAVHPGSHGSLAVTVGADRAVAVLDLMKGKLLTKWKYNPAVATTTEEKATEEDKKSMGSAKEVGSVARSVFAPARETPLGVLFSPSGARLVLFSRFSLVVYETAVMKPLCTFRCATPQPPDEIHCCAFYTEEWLVVGTEGGVQKQFAVQGTVEQPMQVVGKLSSVEVVYPEALAAQAVALMAGPVKVETETRQRNPLRHVNRIKALQVEGATIFSIDSSGIVIAWNVQTDIAAATAQLRVRYVTSANCQGRVTGMALYPL